MRASCRRRLLVDLAPNAGFTWHDHDQHQIAFGTKGVLAMAFVAAFRREIGTTPSAYFGERS